MPDRGSAAQHSAERWSLLYLLRGTALRQPKLKNKAIYKPHWASRSYPLASLPRELRFGGFQLATPFLSLPPPCTIPSSTLLSGPLANVVIRPFPRGELSLPVELHPSAASHSTAAGIDWIL